MTTRLLAALALAVASLAQGAAAQTIRIATAFDPQTFDPHALALLYHTRIVHQVYESLVYRDEKYRVEPGLATAWRQAGPNAWRFTIRQGVTFHDGSPFTVEDAVFSIERSLKPPSQRAFQLKGVTGARKIDAQTMEIVLEAPDAVLPEKLFGLPMMSKAWAEKNNVVVTQDFNAKQETFAVRNSNGTGPYRVERYEPDIRTVLRRWPQWWGWSDKRSGNVQEIVWLTLRSDATRLAALVSGEADAVLDPPLPDMERLKRDPAMSVVASPDLGQQYLAFDQHSDELEGSDVKGKNPFKDRRVRQAVYHAVNVELLVQRVLRGQGAPTGGFLSPKVDGSLPELDKRLPFDQAKARALLAEAGYPNGFSVLFECVNVPVREATCQAMAAMLAQVGIKAGFKSLPTNQFFPKLSGGTVTLAEFGWTPQIDAWGSLNAMFRSFAPGGYGTFNAGRSSNPKLDQLIDAMRVEPDLTRRRAMVATVLRLVADDLPMVPLYRRNLNWAMKRNVTMVPYPNDAPEMRWMRVK